MKPYDPASLGLVKAHVHAIKALGRGVADPDQQIIAVSAIVDLLAGTYDLSYRPDGQGGERDTAFAEGKRWVGLMLRRIITQPEDVLIKEIDNGRPDRLNPVTGQPLTGPGPSRRRTGG